MSTIVELITAFVLSAFGISGEEPPVPIIEETVVIQCCYIEQLPSSDMLVLNNISSIKIEQNRNENTLL